MIYPKDGPILRDRVKLQVLKGFYPTEPNRLQTRYPIPTEATKIEEIKSGAFIVRDTANACWKLATTVAPGDELFIALPDATDHDVQAVGKLVALDVRGDYEIQTPYFKEDTYTLGMKLTLEDGKLAPAGSGATVVATVSGGNETDAIIDLKGQNSSAKDLRVLQVVPMAPTLTA